MQHEEGEIVEDQQPRSRKRAQREERRSVFDRENPRLGKRQRGGGGGARSREQEARERALANMKGRLSDPRQPARAASLSPLSSLSSSSPPAPARAASPPRRKHDPKPHRSSRQHHRPSPKRPAVSNELSPLSDFSSQSPASRQQSPNDAGKGRGERERDADARARLPGHSPLSPPLIPSPPSDEDGGGVGGFRGDAPFANHHSTKRWGGKGGLMGSDESDNDKGDNEPPTSPRAASRRKPSAQSGTPQDHDQGEEGEEGGKSATPKGRRGSAQVDEAVPPPLTPNAQHVDRLRASSLFGCRSVDSYEKLNSIDEGTFGAVFRARDTDTGEVVALKQVKMAKEKNGFPITALREVTALLHLRHPNIVQVREIVIGSSIDQIFMVMEYMENDLKVLLERMRTPFTQSEVKCLLRQLLSAVSYMHENWTLHRDLKTSNLLFDNKGTLKVCDFGLARKYGSPIHAYTDLVVTLWYRSPELLLGENKYSTAVDMWSVGCIFAEMLTREPLFKGAGEIDQLQKIFKLLGTPDDKVWPGFSSLPDAKKVRWKRYRPALRELLPQSSFTNQSYLSDQGFDLLRRMLCYDPAQRISAHEALAHPYFEEKPLAKHPSQMPTFPEANHRSRRRK